MHSLKDKTTQECHVEVGELIYIYIRTDTEKKLKLSFKSFFFPSEKHV